MEQYSRTADGAVYTYAWIFLPKINKVLWLVRMFDSVRLILLLTRSEQIDANPGTVDIQSFFY